MASGKLGAAALAAGVHSTVYTVPAATVATLNVAIVNRGGTDALIRVAIRAAAGNPEAADFVEFDAVVPGAGGVLERTALVAGPGERVIIYSDTADVTARVHGLEGVA